MAAIAVVVVAIGLAYAPVMRDLVPIWTSVPYYSYGMLVPAFSAFALWDSRRELAGVWAARPRPRPALTWIGLVIVGAAALALGTRLGSLSLATASLPFVLSGAALGILGPVGFRAVAFPIAFLVCMAPLPATALEVLSLPMQYGAAAFTAGALHVLGIPVVRDGLFLHMQALTIHVTEACNGLRFLLAMTVVGVAVAWATQRTWRGRLAVMGLALLTAIAANMLRVTLTAVLGHRFGLGAATGGIHVVYGKVVYLAMLAPFTLGVLGIRRLFQPRPGPMSEESARPSRQAVYFSR